MGSVKRGELYYYDFGQNRGHVQDGVRPVLILQGNEANRNSSTTVVAAVTTRTKKPQLYSHVRLSTDFGLKKTSWALLEQTRTVEQEALLDYIGRIDAETLRRIAFGQKKLFELFMPKANTSDTRQV